MKPGPQRIRAALAWWLNRARPSQLIPQGLWLTWLLMAGRGFGKTRTGAETVALWLINRPGCRIALVAATFDDGRDTMVEGESGLLGVLDRYGVAYEWNRSLGQLRLGNGSMADLYSGNKPRQLRGPQHHYAWCDELAWWQYPRQTWDNLLAGLRLGEDGQQRIVVTTTPRPITLLRELVSDDDTVLTRGSTQDNVANLPTRIVNKLYSKHGGTITGQQELEGILLDESEGARWTRAMLVKARRPVEVPALRKTDVGVDPAVKSSETSDNTARVVVGIGPAPTWWEPTPAMKAAAKGSPSALAAMMELPHLYVLHAEQGRDKPTKAMGRAAELADLYDATVIIEDNNGGDYLPAVLHAVDPHCRYRQVNAQGKKLDRAEPLATMYDQERVHHVGDVEELEDTLVTYTGASDEESPDLMDALVWAATDLIPPTARTLRKRTETRVVSA